MWGGILTSEADPKMEGYYCATCGENHPDPPPNYSTEALDQWFAMPPDEGDIRAELTSDQCIVDGQHFFMRSQLELPVIDYAEPFVWGVWISLGEENIWRATDLWEQEGRENEPPCFGWLCTALPGYPDTLNLKTMLHTRPVSGRPFVELEQTDHPLAVEQKNEMTMNRVREIAATVLHQATD
jgi:hypothetical protein